MRHQSRRKSRSFSFTIPFPQYRPNRPLSQIIPTARISQNMPVPPRAIFSPLYPPHHIATRSRNHQKSILHSPSRTKRRVRILSNDHLRHPRPRLTQNSSRHLHLFLAPRTSKPRTNRLRRHRQLARNFRHHLPQPLSPHEHQIRSPYSSSRHTPPALTQQDPGRFRPSTLNP